MHGFGIVGTGIIATTHASAIAAIPGARLVAVTDELTDRAASFAHGRDCTAEPDLDALLRRDDIDVVCVCVPSGMHAEVGVRAAAAGKHLVVEKPLDITLAAADRLIAAVDAAGVSMTVISQHRFDPGLVELRRLLDAGALGDLVFGEATTKWHRTQAYYDSAAWRGTWALDGGGALMNQGIHYVDLLRWTMGPVAEVTAICATRAHQVEVEDVAAATIRFRSGAVGTLIASTAISPGQAQRLEVFGTSGTVVIEDGQIVQRSISGESAAAVTADVGASAAADPADLGVSAHTAQIADLLEAVDTGREPAITGAEGRNAVEIVCAVYESARTGRPVTF